MSIESIKKYMAGKNETLFDIERNVEQVKVIRRLYVKNIEYKYRDFIADISMQDLDYYNKNKVLSPIVNVGKCSIRVANSDTLNEVRIKVINKFPIITESMKGDVNNTLKNDSEAKSNVKDLLKKRISSSLSKSGIRPSGPLVAKINEFIKEYGNKMILPSVSCAKGEGTDAAGRRMEKTNVTFKWENKNQSFTLTLNNDPEESGIVCRAYIVPNGGSTRNMITPIVVINSISDAAPIAHALGTPILVNQKATIVLNPALADGQGNMFRKKGGRRKR